MINLTELAKREKESGRVAEEIEELGAEKIMACIQCGACASICPLSNTGFKLYAKKLVKSILLGLKDELLDDPTPWACVACNRCTEICPRNVSPFEVMFAMRRLMVEEYAIPTLAVEAIRSLYEHGHAVYMTGREARKEVGLPEELPSAESNPKALEELRTILRNTKLSELRLIPMR